MISVVHVYENEAELNALGRLVATGIGIPRELLHEVSPPYGQLPTQLDQLLTRLARVRVLQRFDERLALDHLSL